jgi:hypothetical protein
MRHDCCIWHSLSIEMGGLEVWLKMLILMILISESIAQDEPPVVDPGGGIIGQPFVLFGILQETPLRAWAEQDVWYNNNLSGPGWLEQNDSLISILNLTQNVTA